MKPKEQQILWYREPGNWFWIGLGLIIIILSILLLNQTQSRHLLQSRIDASHADLKASQTQHEDQRVMLRSYDELIRQAGAQREQLIKEIATFEQQIEMLSARSKRLELVSSKLAQLDREFQHFQLSKAAFQRSAGRLEGTASK